MSTIAYPIGRALYLNVTRLCTARCTFCPRQATEWRAWGHDLALDEDPTAAEMIEAVGDAAAWREVVFCGLGEPTLRIERVLAVADALRGPGVRLRLNTNGQGNLVHPGDLTPKLAGRIDAVSISLNAQNREVYDHLCPSVFGKVAYDGVLDFARRVRAHVREVTLTVVEDLPGVDIAACRKIAADLGVSFRTRPRDDLAVTPPG